MNLQSKYSAVFAFALVSLSGAYAGNPVSDGRGCIKSNSPAANGDPAGITFLKVTSVVVNADNVAKITGSDAIISLGSLNYSPRRTNQQFTVVFQLDPRNGPTGPVDPLRKIVAQECINNARIAMASGMNLTVDGGFSFSTPNSWDGCQAYSFDPPRAAGNLGTLHMCVLEAARPDRRNTATITAGSGSAP